MQLTDQHLHEAGTAITRVLTTIGARPLEAQPDIAFRLISQSIIFDQRPDQADLEMTAGRPGTRFLGSVPVEGRIVR